METAQVPEPRSVVIQMLSKRLYSSLSSAIREVVSNSSDADADSLKITFHRTPKAETDEYRLTFFDDGEGMTKSEFENYLTIGSQSRRARNGQNQTRTGGRPLIGLMGVGSLAVAPWCEYISILTKKRGQNKALYAIVEYGKFFEDSTVQSSKITEQYTYRYEYIEVSNEDIESQYTVLDLVNLRPAVVNDLIRPLGEEGLGMFSDGYKQFSGKTAKGGRRSFSNYSGLVRFMHEFALSIPVEYPEGAPVNDPARKRHANAIKAISIAVFLQGVRLHRPMWVLGSQLARHDDSHSGIAGDCGVRNIAEQLPSGIQVQGYIYWQSSQLWFTDLTGLQVRVSNVGIGPYDATWLNYASSSTSARDKNVSGELYIDYSDALLDALKTDREGFDQDSKIYKELQNCIHEHLHAVFKTITQASAKRNKPRTDERKELIRKIKQTLPDVAPKRGTGSNEKSLQTHIDTPLFGETAIEPRPTSVILEESVKNTTENLFIDSQSAKLESLVQYKKINPIDETSLSDLVIEPINELGELETVEDDWLFTLPLSITASPDYKFEDICDVSIEGDRLFIAVTGSHPMYTGIPGVSKDQLARFIAAMAGVAASSPDASPQEMAELTLVRLTNITEDSIP